MFEIVGYVVRCYDKDKRLWYDIFFQRKPQIKHVIIYKCLICGYSFYSFVDDIRYSHTHLQTINKENIA